MESDSIKGNLESNLMVYSYKDLLDQNKQKLIQLYSYYFNNSSNDENFQGSYQSMLPKEKISENIKIEYYLSREEIKLFKVLLFSK